MPNQRAADTHVHNIGIPDDLWEAAQRKATEQRVSVSAVVRYGLAEFVAGRLDPSASRGEQQ